MQDALPDKILLTFFQACDLLYNAEAYILLVYVLVVLGVVNGSLSY